MKKKTSPGTCNLSTLEMLTKVTQKFKTSFFPNVLQNLNTQPVGQCYKMLN